MNCKTCNNGTDIPDSALVQVNEHGLFRTCPDCGGTANLSNEEFKNIAVLEVEE